jgi:hypothetical protein
MDGPAQTAEEQAEYVRSYTQREEALAQCMTQRGFRYVPQPAPSESSVAGVGVFLRYVPVPLLESDRAEVERDGYGLMAAPDPQKPGGLEPDANELYRQSLSPAEADAYQIALQGDYRVPTTEGSCAAEAMDKYPQSANEGDAQSAFRAAHSGVLEPLWDMRTGVFDDSRVKALNQEWEGCMNVKGYRFDEGVTGTGPEAAMVLARETMPDGTAPVVLPGTPVTDIPPEQLSLLGTEPERKVALADFDCRAETDYMARLTAIRVSIDQQFIAEHQAELDRLVAAAESW